MTSVVASSHPLFSAHLAKSVSVQQLETRQPHTWLRMRVDVRAASGP